MEEERKKLAEFKYSADCMDLNCWKCPFEKICDIALSLELERWR